MSSRSARIPLCRAGRPDVGTFSAMVRSETVITCNNIARMLLRLSVLGMFLVAAVNPIGAASITNEPAIYITKDAIKVSIFPGKATYSGTAASGTFGDGTVEAYSLWASAADGSGLTNYATSSAANITMDSYTGNTFGTIYGMYWGDVWTVTDPGSNFSTTPDFDGVSGSLNTIAGIDDEIVSIKLPAGMSTGTVYVLAGAFDDNGTTFTGTVELKGTGQPMLSASITIDPPNNRNMYLLPFSFSTDLAYDTLTFKYTTGALASRTRFMGVILDGQYAEPEGSIFRFR